MSWEGGIIKHFVNEIKIYILKQSCPFSSFGKCLNYPVCGCNLRVNTKSQGKLLGKLVLFSLLPLDLYKIVLEGVVGKGFHGDIAVDDLSLQDGEECHTIYGNG